MANGLFNLKQVIQAVQQGGWPAQKTPAVEYLVVAGGGGGGGATGSGGGGGAGGLLTGIDPVPNGQTLLVTVGASGAGTTTAVAGSNGGNSVFGPITSTGGGGGGGVAGNYAGIAGGSGGGTGADGTANFFGGQGISGQGNSGGLGNTSFGSAPCGGGGGAGTIGNSSYGTGFAGNGGAGIASAISGTVTTYAGGGGGGTRGGTTNGVGGVGGGGAGGNGGANSPVNGTANTGGGGGGGGNSQNGANGGTGIVIVSYPDVYAAAATTVNATVSTSGSGSFSFNGSSQTISTAASSLLALGSGDFTIEYWVKINGSGSFSRTFLITGSSSVSIESNTYTSATTPYYLNYAGTQTAVTTGSSFDVTQWHHVAIVRSGTTNKVYLNGVQAMSATDATSYSSNGTLYIGSNNSANWLNGNVTNFRLVKGTAVYTTAFTPPTVPLTAISGTSILTSAISGAYLADNSGNAFTFTNTGSTAWNSASPFTGTGYKNRVYTWTTSGSITF